jgi:hypothetical protein
MVISGNSVSLVDTQILFLLAGLIPAQLRPEGVDRSKPHYSVSVRSDGPWVGLVGSNSFRALLDGLSLIRGLLAGSEAHLLVERLVRDEDDDTCYHSTVLESSQF